MQKPGPHLAYISVFRIILSVLVQTSTPGFTIIYQFFSDCWLMPPTVTPSAKFYRLAKTPSYATGFAMQRVMTVFRKITNSAH